jgi:hypothetical protein
MKSMQEIKILGSEASFAEVQIHDKLKGTSEWIRRMQTPKEFKGYLTLHGEGETDGRRILFCSDEKDVREKYVKESANLYNTLSDILIPHKIKRIIVHPDTLVGKSPRSKKLEYLAQSLLALEEQLDDLQVCIEPRGCDRQRKVLRAEIEDIRILQEKLNSIGINKIGLCLDIAQLFIVHGNNGIVLFLDELRSLQLRVKEFHISDVYHNKKVTNRVAMEVGTGSIDWHLILPLLLQHCNELLIETLGGIKVYQRSKSFLESLVR